MENNLNIPLEDICVFKELAIIRKITKLKEGDLFRIKYNKPECLGCTGMRDCSSYIPQYFMDKNMVWDGKK